MMTPTDTHYLVGLLSELTAPDDVEVELGSMIFDEATQSNRDVDVTVRVSSPNGEKTVYKAIEVKALKRKLGSDKVEQLIQKMADMPAIDQKVIVSASGFTKQAAKKAQAHSVELYELKAWISSDDVSEFGHILLPGVFTSYQWIAPARIKLNPSDILSEDEKALVKSNPLVSFPDQANHEPLPLLEWLARFKSITASELQRRLPESCEPLSISEASVSCAVMGLAVIENERSRVVIRELQFNGQFERRTIPVPSTFKALYRLGSNIPVAGCCVSELPDKSLMSMAITRDKRVQLGVVPLSERNAGRLYKKRFNDLTEQEPLIE